MNSPFKTQKFGRFLAEMVLEKQFRKTAVVIALRGELGAGKTTLIQGFAKGLGIKSGILSPTFIIMKKFSIPKKPFKTFFHFDCYRIENEKEILELGFREIVSDPRNIVCIEWPEKIKSIVPRNAVWLRLSLGKNRNQRKIILNGVFTEVRPL